MDSVLPRPDTIVTADGKTLCAYNWSLKEPSITVALVHGYGEYAGRYKHVASYLNSKAIGMVGTVFFEFLLIRKMDHPNFMEREALLNTTTQRVSHYGLSRAPRRIPSANA